MRKLGERELRGSPVHESSHPERVPIKWNNLIDKDAARGSVYDPNFGENRYRIVVAPDRRLLRRNALAQNLRKIAAPILNEDGQCFQGRGVNPLAEMALRETLGDGLFLTRRVNAKPENVVGQLRDGESARRRRERSLEVQTLLQSGR